MSHLARVSVVFVWCNVGVGHIEQMSVTCLLDDVTVVEQSLSGCCFGTNVAGPGWGMARLCTTVRDVLANGAVLAVLASEAVLAGLAVRSTLPDLALCGRDGFVAFPLAGSRVAIVGLKVCLTMAVGVSSWSCLKPVEIPTFL